MELNPPMCFICEMTEEKLFSKCLRKLHLINILFSMNAKSSKYAKLESNQGQLASFFWSFDLIKLSLK